MPKLSMEQPFASLGEGALQIRRRPRRRLLTSERGLGLAGLALAVASGSFASYMISDTDRQPRFSGAEYLTVFAKLTPTGRGQATPGFQPTRPDSADADDLATASVARSVVIGVNDKADAPTPTAIDVAPPPIPSPTAVVKGYVLRSVFQGAALIESPQGLREVKPGAILPNVGLVTAIERRDGKWVVVTSQGLIREASR